MERKKVDVVVAGQGDESKTAPESTAPAGRILGQLESLDWQDLVVLPVQEHTKMPETFLSWSNHYLRGRETHDATEMTCLSCSRSGGGVTLSVCTSAVKMASERAEAGKGEGATFSREYLRNIHFSFGIRVLSQSYSRL